MSSLWLNLEASTIIPRARLFLEAWSRLSELRSVAHAYIAYGLLAPLVHGALGFGAGFVAVGVWATGLAAAGVLEAPFGVPGFGAIGFASGGN